IRCRIVTGVQTCALPIYAGAPHKVSAGDLARHRMSSFTFLYTGVAAYFSSWFDSITGGAVCQSKPRIFHLLRPFFKGRASGPGKIGRASCRERVKRSAGAGRGKRKEREEDRALQR